MTLWPRRKRTAPAPVVSQSNDAAAREAVEQRLQIAQEKLARLQRDRREPWTGEERRTRDRRQKGRA